MKYPRTFHLPFSKSVQNDDKVCTDFSLLYNKRIIVLEKLDGENTTILKSHYHARSLDSDPHTKWRSHINILWSIINYMIPDNVRICGENMYAKHSIYYDNLIAYFYAFSVWDNQRCLSWPDTLSFLHNIETTLDVNLPTPKVLYDGIFDLDVLENLEYDPNKCEGFVIRPYDEFMYDDFSKVVLKSVRENHVQTDKHWSKNKIISNKLI